MLGTPGAGYHLEFTFYRAHAVAPSPTPEDLLVFYIPEQEAWDGRCNAMLNAGFSEVEPYNPSGSASAARLKIEMATVSSSSEVSGRTNLPVNTSPPEFIPQQPTQRGLTPRSSGAPTVGHPRPA